MDTIPVETNIANIRQRLFIPSSFERDITDI